MALQLWEIERRNCVAEFVTRDEAFAAVRELVVEHGANAVVSLLLVIEDAEGNVQKVAGGKVLAALAAPVPTPVNP